MARDFTVRSTEPEWMDAGDCPYETFRACLADLARVNVATLAHRPTLAFLEALRRDGRLDLGRPIEIVDVGSGYGDLVARIRLWAAENGVPVRLTGVDLNPWSARAAREAQAPDPAVRWETSDIFAYAGRCDIAVSSLFTHHLTDEAIVRFLVWMEETCRIGWFINDLHRHPVPYWGFSLLSRLMRWHPFVRHDGPVSIARAFTADDWLGYLQWAGAQARTATVSWRFPFRLCVARRRTP